MGCSSSKPADTVVPPSAAQPTKQFSPSTQQTNVTLPALKEIESKKPVPEESNDDSAVKVVTTESVLKSTDTQITLQPIPAYVIKTSNDNKDKLFINIFHAHQLPHKDTYLIQNKTIVPDKKGEQCWAYQYLISSELFQETEKNLNLKEKLILSIFRHINETFSDAHLDLRSLKLPKVKKCYMGDAIPTYIIDKQAPPPPIEDISNETLPPELLTSQLQAQQLEEDVTILAHPTEDYDAPYSNQIPCPPKMLGWLNKRGHVVLNWKTRYFVLNNGFLTYYVDKLDTAPYGKTMKGQICLLGYREQSFIDANNLPSPTRSISAAPPGDSTYRIHLIYVPGIIDDSIVDNFRQTVNKNLKKFGSSSKEPTQELLLEANTIEEKYAWMAAIEAHIQYIEYLAQCESVDESTYDFLKLEEVQEQIQQENELTLPEPVNSSINETTPVPPLAPSPEPVVPIVKPKPTPNLANRLKWGIHISPKEEVILVGLINKPNAMKIAVIRELIFVVNKEENTKRLIYVDPSSYELKGEISWATKPYPMVRKADENSFEIITAANKAQKFLTKDNLTVDDWVDMINSTSPVV